jgi:hypothetical protein
LARSGGPPLSVTDVVGLFILEPTEAAPPTAAAVTEAETAPWDNAVAVERLVGAMVGGSRRGEGRTGAVVKTGRGVGTRRFVGCCRPRC